MSEEIHARLDSFQSRLAAIKSQHSEQMKTARVSRTTKRLARESGGVLGELLTGTSLGKQLGKAVVSDIVESDKKQNVETIENQCIRSMENLVQQIKSFLSNVSVFYKTNPATNSNEIIQRFKSVESQSSCHAKITRLSQVLASLQSKTLVFNTDLQNMVKTKRTPKSEPKPEPSAFKLPLVELIQEGENESIEFKSTLRWDILSRMINKDLEHAVVRSIAGFMNSKGGVLLIGVNDDGKITGLEEDFNTLAKKNNDGFELHLRQLIEARLGKVCETLVKVRFEENEGKRVCIVCIDSSDIPVFLKSKGKAKEFPVKLGNSTKSLDVEESARYISGRWLK